MKKIIYTLTALVLFTPIFTYAQPGSLDSTFSGDGINNKVAGDGYAVAIQPDKKIIVAGSYNKDFLVVRYLQNGNIDKTFGTNGKTIVDIGRNDVAYCVALQLDGKIIAAGTASKEFALLRLNTDGQPDSSFGVNGKVTTNFSQSDYIKDIAIQPDNKIIVIGFGEGEVSKLALARYNSDGTLDSSFGEYGEIAMHTTDLFDEGAALVLQPNGKIVAVESNLKEGTGSDFILLRFTRNGKLDTSFGTNGITSTDFGNNEIPVAAGAQHNNKIIVAGYFDYGGTYDILLARYTKNGRLDSSFGTNGKVITSGDSGPIVGSCMAIQPDDKIVVAGILNDPFSDDKFYLVRYKPNGKIDSSFGDDGRVITNFGGHDIARSVALQSNGKIIVAGSIDENFAVARFNGGDASVNIAGAETVSDLKTIPELTATAIKVYPNPLKSVINIDFKTTDKTQKIISIYNVQGPLLLTKRTAGNTQLNMKSLANSNYFIKVYDENGKTLYSSILIKQ
ncbi:MAG: T9SS type A sorting domain-containing protein [Parafilimonas sp.]